MVSSGGSWAWWVAVTCHPMRNGLKPPTICVEAEFWIQFRQVRCLEDKHFVRNWEPHATVLFNEWQQLVMHGGQLAGRPSMTGQMDASTLALFFEKRKFFHPMWKIGFTHFENFGCVRERQPSLCHPHFCLFDNYNLFSWMAKHLKQIGSKSANVIKRSTTRITLCSNQHDEQCRRCLKRMLLWWWMMFWCRAKIVLHMSLIPNLAKPVSNMSRTQIIIINRN